MPRLTQPDRPSIATTRAPDRAVVYIDGKAQYLGEYNSPESKDAYKAHRRRVGRTPNQ